ncbi:MAG: ABC transporter ATP-binding protein [Burkholderiaceae bacterium]
MNALLRLEALDAGYGEVPVLHGVSLEVRPGQIVAVIGSNGAGKTTLLKTVAGLLSANGGKIWFDSTDCTRADSHIRVADGLTLVPEGRLIFPEMTVQENLRVGAINPRARSARNNTMTRVLELFPRLAQRLHQLGGTLSGGEQQMLALGRGLMAQPRLLLLDEPTLGLAPGIAREIFQIVPRLVAGGVTVLVAEQDVRRTLQMADYAYLVENGRIGLQGSGAQLLDDPQVRRAYLGL